MIGVAAIGAAGWFLYDTTREPDNELTQIPPVRSVPADSPLVAPIDDAQSVVDDLNDNSQEAELLDQLGLDPQGQPQPAPQPPGYRFTTVDTDGSALNVLVDTTTGNYSIESAAGFGFRSIDGALVARTGPTEPWTPIEESLIESIQRVGLDRLVTKSDIITTTIAPWVSVVSSDDVDNVTTTLFRVDVASLNAEQPAALVEWAGPFGLDPASLVSATSEPMTILVQLDQDGVVKAYTITAPGADGVNNYRLDEVYAEPPAISL